MCCRRTCCNFSCGCNRCWCCDSSCSSDLSWKENPCLEQGANSKLLFILYSSIFFTNWSRTRDLHMTNDRTILSYDPGSLDTLTYWHDFTWLIWYQIETNCLAWLGKLKGNGLVISLLRSDCFDKPFAIYIPWYMLLVNDPLVLHHRLWLQHQYF